MNFRGDKGRENIMKQLYGVIGDPIAHSMSPSMHNDLFQLYEMDAIYLPFHVKKENLADAVRGFKAINVKGFNVTVPHKTDIIPLLDEIDPLAQAIGAVNTVVNIEGRFIGYNTDGSGFIEGLKKELDSFKDKKILMVGAGGAARAIYYTLSYAGAEYIDIANRTPEKANKIVQNWTKPIQTELLTLQEAENNIGQYDVIVQTTSIGMHPNMDVSPICLDKLKQNAVACDIIYTPLETKFLQDARKLGARVQNGIPMFVYQGALAFEKWTGIFPDTKRMETIVLKQLGGI